MPGKSPHAHERPAWHAPAQRPCTGQRPGAAARPHPRGMSFCPSKAISHPVPKPRLRGLSRAMAPRPVPPHRDPPRERLSRPPRNARQKPPEGANRPHPTQKAPSKAACRKSARPFLGPPSPQPSTNDSSRRKRNGHPPKRRRILPKTNAPVPPHRDPPHKRLPSPAKRAEKSPRRGPSDHIQRGKSHQKPRAERARGLSLGPPSPQPSTNDSSRRKRNGHPRGAGTSSQRQTRPSLPTGTLRANASRPPRNARQKAPERANRPPPTRKVPPKAAYRKSARPFPWPAIPAAINKRLFAPQKKRASPGAQAHPPKGKCACPSPPGPSARTPPVPREPRSKKAPWEPTDRVQCRAAFSLCSPRLSRNTAANRHVPWEERGLFASTRAVSPAGRF